jgi:hypothetical protein
VRKKIKNQAFLPVLAARSAFIFSISAAALFSSLINSRFPARH